MVIVLYLFQTRQHTGQRSLVDRVVSRMQTGCSTWPLYFWGFISWTNVNIPFWEEKIITMTNLIEIQISFSFPESGLPLQAAWATRATWLRVKQLIRGLLLQDVFNLRTNLVIHLGQPNLETLWGWAYQIRLGLSKWGRQNHFSKISGQKLKSALVMNLLSLLWRTTVGQVLTS